MPKSMPLRASGDFAGLRCDDQKCRRYARFAVTYYSDDSQLRRLACGVHLANAVKGEWLTKLEAVVVQEVPGNWYSNGNDYALVDGVMIKLRGPMTN